MSLLKNEIEDITNEELRADLEKMKIQKARIERLIRKIDTVKSEKLIGRNEN